MPVPLSTFDQSVIDFNAAFSQPSVTKAYQFGDRYYDPYVIVTTPNGRKLTPRDAVLTDFVATAPLVFTPARRSLDPSGKVVGDGQFQDMFQNRPRIRHIKFEFTWVQNPSGNWIVTVAFSQ
jgi:hypothetical protein